VAFVLVVDPMFFRPFCSQKYTLLFGYLRIFNVTTLLLHCNYVEHIMFFQTYYYVALAHYTGLLIPVLCDKGQRSAVIVKEILDFST
jgi:hypothetical protein